MATYNKVRHRKQNAAYRPMSTSVPKVKSGPDPIVYEDSNQVEPEQGIDNTNINESINEYFDEQATPQFNQATNSDNLEGQRASKNSQTQSSSSTEDSPTDLKKAEESDTKDSKSDSDSQDEENLFKEDDKSSSRSVKAKVRKKRGIIGSIIAITGVSGSALFGSVVSGPLNLMQMSSLFERFHFSNQVDDDEIRLAKIGKALNNLDKPQNVRLSLLGNVIADRWESKMAAAGFEPQYKERTGYFDGYKLDVDKLMDNSELSISDRSPDGIRDYMKSEFDVDVVFDTDGTPRINSDIPYRKLKPLNRAVLKSSGYTKIGSYVRSRTLMKRYAKYSWIFHPIKNLDQAVVKAGDKALAWAEERKKNLKSGEVDVESDVDKPEGEDTDGGGGQADTDSSDSLKDTVDSTKTDVGSSKGSRWKSFQDSPKVKGAGVVTAVVGVACMAKSLFKNYDQIQHDSVFGPLLAFGGEAMGVGNQVMATAITGNVPDLDQLSYYTQKMVKDEASWIAGMSVQSELGEPLTGSDVPDEVRSLDSEGNPVSNLLNMVPGLDSVCGAAESMIGGIALTIFGFATGPFSALVGEGLNRTVMPMALDSVLGFFTDDLLDLSNASGMDFGNLANWGTRLMSNETCIASGCRTLTNAEAAQLKSERIARDKEEHSKLSLASRLFDAKNHKTLAGKIINTQSSDIAANLKRTGWLAFNPFASLSSVASIAKPRSALASSEYKYDFPKAGFSQSEIEDSRFDNPFDPKIQSVLSNSSLIDRADKCFGVTISSDGTVSSNDTPPIYKDLRENNCDDTSEDWLRLRFYIKDVQIMEGFACFEGVNDKACSNIGVQS